MPNDVAFQVLTLPGQAWEQYRDQVLHVERLGFDVAAVPDHFCDWANPPAPWLECWTLMAALAVETSTIRLATNVSQIPLRNPGVLAHQAVTVDHISGGRVELGIGTGLTIDPGTEMVGLPNWSNAERASRFGEYIELLGLLLNQDITTYQGDYYSANEAVMNPSSRQRPRLRLVAAALGPRMMRHTARFADGWNTMSFNADFGEQLDELSERNSHMDELCVELGRAPSELRRSVNLFDAEARAAGGRLRYYDDENLLVELIQELSKAGYTEFGLYYPSDATQLEAFEHIARDIVPTLR
ncbi:MAG: alkanesulfonate monooxygenase SsuD [Candidatus Poriferisodalaceae bacterium]|jgi:alkanesulfonate monooxygenase SsuD/methylene tetrahydromethanopterin reductase-like flavin-dependent oxidoreductase (luciferase family)